MSATDTTAPSTDSRGAGAIQPQKRKSDKYIWAIYILLLIVSVIELYSASSREVVASNVAAPLMRHCTMLLLGIVLTVGISRLHYKWLIPLTPIFVTFTVLLGLYVLFKGDIINGAAAPPPFWASPYSQPSC